MANMIPISTVTVGSGGAASIDFTGIPQIYTDLLLKISARTNRAAGYDFPAIKFNGSSAGYTDKVIYGSGSNTASESNNSTSYAFGYFINAATSTSNSFSNSDFYIPNYTSSNNKSMSQEVVYENNGTTAFQSLASNLWSNTSPITSINITPVNGAVFTQYSTFTLYGIRKY